MFYKYLFYKLYSILKNNFGNLSLFWRVLSHFRNKWTLYIFSQFKSSLDFHPILFLCALIKSENITIQAFLFTVIGECFQWNYIKKHKIKLLFPQNKAILILLSHLFVLQVLLIFLVIIKILQTQVFLHISL